MGTGIAISIAQRTITAEAALAVVQAAVAHANALDIRINVAVCDGGGVQMAFLRMPGAFLHSVEIAIDKAYTSVSFGFATAQWPQIFADDAALRTGMPHRPRLVAFGGGLPIRDNGDLIGGVGVSGGSAEQDAACARAGLVAIGLA